MSLLALRACLLALAACALPGCRSTEAPASSNLVPASATSEVADAPSAQGSATRFTDITRRAGIGFTHNNGGAGAKFAPETMGSGVAFLDYDGDGWQDLFFVNGRDWTPQEVAAYKGGAYREHQRRYKFSLPPARPRRRTTSVLYRNNRDGTFSDVSKGSGLDVELYGMGVAVGDYDGDGRSDLFVSGYGRNALFRNASTSRAPRFVDATAPSGVRGPRWSTSAAWLDYDGDGRLDLFVCGYLDWEPARDAYQPHQGRKAVSGPDSYKGQLNHLYRNVGGGRFEDVSIRAGIHRAQPNSKGARKTGPDLVGKGLGVTVCDYNNDLRPDIVVANDRVPNFLWQNRGDGTFAEVATRAGIARGKMGLARSGMGIDAGDIDGSNRESIVITNFSGEMVGVYRNNGRGLLDDVAVETGVGRSSLLLLGFGCLLADVNLDGWLDIFVVNGHVNDLEPLRARMPSLLFLNRSGTGLGQRRLAFEDVTARSGPSLREPIMGRGLAQADIDLDGDLDVAISTNAGPPMLLRNDGQEMGNAVRVVLRGASAPREGIGAVVWAVHPGASVRRRVRSGSSYLSQSELPVTLGLGAAQSTEVVVRWPKGKLQRFKGVAANQILTIDEGKGIVRRERLRR